MLKRIECKITGRVQMVLFRDSACRRAKKLGLAGIVRNDKDGSVFAVAEGEEDKLKEFIEYLKKGPPLARVDGVEVLWFEAAGEFAGFNIKY